MILLKIKTSSATGFYQDFIFMLVEMLIQREVHVRQVKSSFTFIRVQLPRCKKQPFLSVLHISKPEVVQFFFFFFFFLESSFVPYTDFGKNLHVGRKIIALFRYQYEKFPVYSESNHFIIFPTALSTGKKHPFWTSSVSDVGVITIKSQGFLNTVMYALFIFTHFRGIFESVWVQFDDEFAICNRASRNECSPTERSHVKFVFRILRQAQLGRSLLVNTHECKLAFRLKKFWIPRWGSPELCYDASGDG